MTLHRDHDQAEAQHIYDAIVIGAGISGLAAASYLAERCHRVVTLESRSRIGGRVDSREIGRDGLKVDMGASFIHGRYDNPIHDLAEDIGLPLFDDDHEAVPRCFDSNGEIDPREMKQVLINANDSFFEHGRGVSSACDPAPHDSLGGYIFAPASPLFAHLHTAQERFRAQTFIRAWSGWTGADLGDVSLKWWGFERDTLGPDRLVRAGGYMRVAEYLAERSGEIRLDSLVTRIEKADDGTVAVTIITPTGEVTLQAKHVICTLPLGILQSQHTALFHPPLPPRKQAAISRLGFGILAKIALRYDSAWWKNPSGSSMFFLFPTEDQPRALCPPGSPAELHPQCVMVQDFDLIDRTPILLLFFGASLGAAVETGDRDMTVAWADRTIKTHLSAPKGTLPPPHAEVTSWRSDPHSLGSYTYIPPSSSSTGMPPSPLDLAEFAVPIWDGTLGFAGEHTHANRYASVHGAYETGLREGKRVHVALM